MKKKYLIGSVLALSFITVSFTLLKTQNSDMPINLQSENAQLNIKNKPEKTKDLSFTNSHKINLSKEELAKLSAKDLEMIKELEGLSIEEIDKKNRDAFHEHLKFNDQEIEKIIKKGDGYEITYDTSNITVQNNDNEFELDDNVFKEDYVQNLNQRILGVESFDENRIELTGEDELEIEYAAKEFNDMNLALMDDGI